MHEYSIVQSLLASVETAVGARAASVHGIEVRIGEISGVDPELLATAYEVFRAGTLCERAAMVIQRVPVRWECPCCGGAIGAGRALRCGECDEPARLAAGD